MEFWAVVAAAGAGYVAQCLQSSSEENQFCKISTDKQSNNRNLLHHPREKVCPFHKLAQKRAKNEVPDEGILFRFRELNLDSSNRTSDVKDSGREHTSTTVQGTKILVDHSIQQGYQMEWLYCTWELLLA